MRENRAGEDTLVVMEMDLLRLHAVTQEAFTRFAEVRTQLRAKLQEEPLPRAELSAVGGAFDAAVNALETRVERLREVERQHWMGLLPEMAGGEEPGSGRAMSLSALKRWALGLGVALAATFVAGWYLARLGE